jgi:hypothetical protein
MRLRTILFLSFSILLLAQLERAQAQAQTNSAQGEAVKPALPDTYKMDMLIRTTLIALSQANRTGNYTVLRDLGSPAFLTSVSPARLSDAFVDLRNRKVDFSPVLFFTPKLTEPPTLDQSGRLRLKGFLETRPEQIEFDMTFENVAGDWRVYGLSVRTQLVPPPTAAIESNTPAKFGAPAAKMMEAAKKNPPPGKNNPASKK